MTHQTQKAGRKLNDNVYGVSLMKPWERYSTKQSKPWDRYKDEVDQDKGIYDNLMAGVNKGISYNPVSLAVDAANYGLSFFNLDTEMPVGGSDHIQSLFESWGISTKPDEDSVSGAIGTEVGANISGGGVLAAAGKVTNLGRYVQPMVDYYTANPVSSLLMDTGIAVPAVYGEKTGGYIGEKIGGEQGRQTGEQLGRITGPLAPAGTIALASKAGRRVDHAFPITKGAQKRAAGDILKSRQSKQGIPDVPAPEYGKPATGELWNDAGLIALRRRMDRESQIAAGRSQDVASSQNQSLRKGLSYFNEDVDAAPRFFRKKVDDAIESTNRNIKRTMEKAKRAVSNMDVDDPLDEIEKQTRVQLNAALTVARNKEKEIWTDIPAEYYDISVVKETADVKVTSVSKYEDPQEIHPLIYQIAGKKPPPNAFDEYGNAVVAESEMYEKFFQGDEKIQDILVLRKRLLSAARKERGNGNWNRARHLKEISFSMINDITPVGENVSRAMVDDARDYSRELNTVFTEGPIGDVLGYSTKGGLKVSPEVTLEHLIVPGTKGKLGARSLESSSQYLEDPNAISNGIKNFLKKKFVAHAINDEGTLNVTKAGNFIKDYSVLDDYPDLKARMGNAKQASTIADEVSKSGVRRIKHIENVTAAGRYTKGEPAVQMESVLNSQTPLKDMKSLMRLAKRDKSGRSIKGLKKSFYDSMMSRVAPDAAQGLDATGDTLVRAKQLRQFMKKYRPVVKELYGEGGVDILKEVSKGATINARVTRGIAAGGGSDTRQNTAEKIGTIAGVLGTKMSGGVHELLAFGIAKRWSMKMYNLLNESGVGKINDLVHEALYDQNLAKQLMSKPTEVNVRSLMNDSTVRNILFTDKEDSPFVFDKKIQSAPGVDAMLKVS